MRSQPRIEPLEPRRLLATYVVDSVGDERVADDGQVTLREAIEFANSNSGLDTIEFLPTLRGRTIRLTGSPGVSHELPIVDDVRIVGLGSDSLTIEATGNFRLFGVERSELLLSGITLAGGRAFGGAVDNGLGGAIYNNSGTVSLDEVTIVDNGAIQGGAIFNESRDDFNALLIVNNSLIADNTADDRGGAIGSSGGVVQIFNSTLQRNLLTSPNAMGGGISSIGTRVVVSGSAVALNQSRSNGGGIYLEGGSLDLRDSSIEQNQAGQDGGGIYADQSVVGIRRSSIVDNVSSRDGGGALIRQDDANSVIRIDTSTLSGNTANNDAGGIYFDAATAELLSSTVAYNRADADESGIGDGGGLFISNGRSPLMHNTLVAGNVAAASFSDIVGTVAALSSANLVSDAASAGGLTEDPTDTIPNLIGRDPQTVIGALAPNGGGTLTHELLSGSPAIDAGDRFEIRDANGDKFQNTIDLRVVTDQRGITRLRDPFNDRVDIGAFERRSDVDRYYDGDFSVSGVSQFGLDIGLVQKTERFVIPIQTGDVSVGGFIDVLDSRTGLEIDFGASGEAGVEVGFFVDTGSINANYSANLSQSYVEPDAVGPVRLSSNVAYFEARFNTTSPGFGAYADLILNLDGYIDAEGCLVGVCGSVGDEFSFDFGQELAAINRNRDGQIRINEEQIPIEGDINPPFSLNIGKFSKIPPLDGSIDGECKVEDFHIDCKETLTAELDKKLVGDKLKDLADLGLEFELAEFRQSFPPRIELGSTSSDSDGVMTDESNRADVSPCADNDEPLPPGTDRTFLASLCVQAGNLALIAAGKPPLGGPISFSIDVGTDENSNNGPVEPSLSLLTFSVTPMALELGPALYAHQQATVLPFSTITYSFDQPVTIRPSGGGPAITGVSKYTVPAATATKGSFLDIDFTGKPIQVDAVWTRGIDLNNLIDLQVTIEGLLTILDLGIESDLIDFEAIGLPLDPDPLIEEDFRLAEFPPITVMNKTIPLLREEVKLESFTIGDTFTPSLNVTRKGDSGAGSLRNAVESARLLDNEEQTNPDVPDIPHAIYLDEGTYILDVSNFDNATIGGDLDIFDTDLSIIGAGSEKTSIVVSGSLDRVFDIHDGSELNLVGVTLVNGNPDSNHPDNGFDGGSIRNRGELHLNDVVIRGASASNGDGGAIFNASGATLTITGSTIESSHAIHGGAIYNEGDSTIVTSTIGATNLTTNDVFQAGGVGCTTAFCNQAEIFGGGIYNAAGGSLGIEQTTVSDNRAQFGGGIYNAGELSIRYSTVAANNAIGQDGESTSQGAGGGGGGAGLGGGIFNESGTLDVANSTLSLNHAIGGDAGEGSLWSSSAANNEVGGRGGGPDGGSGGNLVQDTISTRGGFGSGGGGGGTGPTSVARNRGSVSSGSSFGGGGGGAAYRDRVGTNDTDNFADTNGNLGGGGRGANSVKGSRQSGDGGGGGGDGGGIFHRAGLVTVVSSTIVENAAIGGRTGRTNSAGENGFGIGGGIYAFESSAPLVNNSIVANNLADVHADANGTFTDNGNNLVESRSINQVGILYTGQSNGINQPADLLSSPAGNAQAQTGLLQPGVMLSRVASDARFGESSIQFGPIAQLSRLQLPNSQNLGNSFTLAAFVRTDLVSLTRLFSTFDGSGSPASNELIFDFATDGSSVNGMRFRLGAQSVSPNSPIDFSDGLYHHLAATYDQGSVTIYLDGDVVGTGSIANQSVVLRDDLHVGEDIGGSFNEQLLGNVDDVLMLRRAMTAPEIAQLASDGALALFAAPPIALFGVDPQLSPLGDFGGPTFTHVLLPGSPAIGAGDASLLPRDDEDNLVPDQRGFERANADIGSTGVIPDSVDISDDSELSLRQAITVFNVQGGTNTIHLSAGTYSLGDFSARVGLPDSAQLGDLDIMGQTLTIVGDGATETIIDASMLGDRVFDVHRDASLHISGVQIVGGSAPVGQRGGGIRNAGDLNLQDSVVTGNSAATGGGIYNLADASATIARTTISNNRAEWGGGVHSVGTLHISSSALIENSAIGLDGLDAPRNLVDQGGQGGGGGGGGGGLGGALFLETGNAELTNVTIALNHAVGGNGGDGLDNSQNRPFGPGGDGGGLDGGDAGDPNSLQGQMAGAGLFGGGGGGGGSVTGTASPIGGDGGMGGGGGGGGAIVETSQSGDGGVGGSAGLGAGNGGTGSRETNRRLAAGAGGGGGAGIGGGIFQRSGTLTIQSSTIVENRTEGGLGGMTVVTGNNLAAQVRSNPGNDGSGVAGGVHHGEGTTRVTNTIIATNLADVATDVSGVFESFDGNLIGESVVGNGFGAGDQQGASDDPLDPGLSALANHDGPTVTAAPTVGSLAIDRGTTTTLLTDQRGRSRVAAGIVDVGAFETDDVIEEFVLDVTADALGENSLRQAIIDANNMPGPQIIDLGAGTYTLSLAGIDELAAATGDLNILDDLTIVGVGADRAAIDASSLGDRALHVASGVKFYLSGVTIRGGATSADGGGLLNHGIAILEEVEITGNAAKGGGGISNRGSIEVLRSNIAENAASDDGGGIEHGMGTLRISNSTISSNQSGRAGGGLFAIAATDILSSTITANTAVGTAGGLTVEGPGENSIRNTIVASNFAPSSSDVLGSLHSSGFNLVGDADNVVGLLDTDIPDIDPQLQTLGEYGGTTRTHLPQMTSPAVNAGGGSGPLSDGEFDQRGSPRIVGVIDIGSAEIRSLMVDRQVDDLSPGSLRAAIRSANSLPGFDAIDLAAGVYVLTLSGDDDDEAISGDLDILGNLSIRGAGANVTIIDAGGLGDRVFDIFDNLQFSLSGVTVRGGESATEGGAIQNRGTTTISKVRLTENRAAGGAAIVNRESGSLEIVQTTIDNNVATNRGGGILNLDHASTTAINTTVSSNRATEGAGIASTSDVVARVGFSTVAANSASAVGGGILGSHQLWNTIVAGNVAPAAPDVSGAIQSDGFNLIQDTSGVTGLVADDRSGDPLIGTLQFNGGRLMTHALMPGSPAIDAGNASLAGRSAPSVDQRNFSRDQATVDIGAVELQIDFAVSVPTGDDTSVSDAGNGLTRIVVAGAGIDALFPTPQHSIRITGGAQPDNINTNSTPASISVSVDVGGGDDVITIGPGTIDKISGGDGYDVVAIGSAGIQLDLTALGIDAILGIEEIDIRGTGSNALTIGPNEVQNASTTNLLSVYAGIDDTVNLGVGWKVEAPIFADSAQRHVLLNGDARIELINALPFQNPYAPTDVNFSGETTSLDALQIINFLGRFDSTSFVLTTPTSAEELPERYFDVNGSETVTALDALNVINFLGRILSGEPELGGVDTPAQLLRLPIAPFDAFGFQRSKGDMHEQSDDEVKIRDAAVGLDADPQYPIASAARTSSSSPQCKDQTEVLVQDERVGRLLALDELLTNFQFL